MKTKLILISSFALAAMAVGCSKDEGSHSENQGGSQANIAYLAVSVEAEGTRAQGENSGTKEEGTVSTAYAVTFDASYQKLNVVALTVGTTGSDLTVGADGKPTATPSKAISVSPNTRYLMMVLNPSQNLLSAMSGAASFADFQQKVLDDVADLTIDDRFTMINRGAISGTSMGNMHEMALADCQNKVFTAADGGLSVDAAKAAAANAPVAIPVVRLVAKVGLGNALGTPLAGIVENGASCEFVAWQFNTVNKTYLPYSTITSYVDQDGVLVTDNRIYRKDGNYEGTENPANEFYFLKNSDNVAGAGNEIAWRTTSTGYVLENTMAPNAQLQGYTTRMVVKARYTPAGITVNDTWAQYVKEGVEGAPETITSLETKMASDTDLASLLTSIAAELQYTSAAELIAALNADDGTNAQLNNVGYIAAKYSLGGAGTESYVRIYRKSECYYDLLIQHNSNLPEPMVLGKYGVVRNNWYTLNVTKVSKPGTSFIPDPTDPSIVDPSNPDPADPNEDTNSYISVTVTIMPWTLWQQDIEI